VTTARSIHLGFEVGSGKAVEIPVRHLCVTGQTQEAGKTTTLEALIARSTLRALAFITKPGEASFAGARGIAPYFREQADWRFVASLLEAHLGERLKFERNWISRAAEGQKTLEAVRTRAWSLAESARGGFNQDQYRMLGVYLDELLPAIAAIPWATRLELDAGVNVVDVSGASTSIQNLVIKSSIDWVLERERDVVVVVPEAWKFVPQGRGTPVKLSAAAFIRQGAAKGNYLWIDSQDLGGVEKEILRSVAVWLLGVQREANEIKRTLENIPAPVRPKAQDVQTLELGQFVACWGKHAIRTYVQPVWISDHLARQVATGVLDVRNASAIAAIGRVRRAAEASGFTSVGAIARQLTERPKEERVTKDEAARLTRENEELRTERNALKVELASLRLRLEALEKGQYDVSTAGGASDREGVGRGNAAARSSARAPAPREHSPRAHGSRTESIDVSIDEALYQTIKARLLADAPALLKVLAEGPELDITIERRLIEADGSSLRGRVAQLIKAGWFNDVKSGHSTFEELKRRGFSTSKPNVYKECDKLAEFGFLTKESGGYQVVADAVVRVVDRRIA